MNKKEQLEKINSQIEFGESRLELARKTNKNFLIKNAAVSLQQLKNKKKTINKIKKNKPGD